ncbi:MULTISPECIES: cyclodeaminase/cyclohydrolase family protein [Clostridium]|uniref:Cyclodeaminase/cyclohydrolase family protein n=1 Tax=Clostridium cibarium TaxID=2762247 RepID=A0ABR8PPH3_9CLOT|nr:MULTISPECIES: cyclodeaminase/cyclohydrolase family protein [Clostridium]MBD7910072.1 cyclodeaminase/cyclohydrolase family protein [Clostridium cibarium]
MEFKDYRVGEFIEDLSSSSPSPGGGSVAGLVSALAGSLNSMVYSLTVNKKSFEALDIDTKKVILDFCEASKKFTKKSLILMEDDRRYFNELMDCYKLKKDTDEEKEKRNKGILEGTLKAMKAPLELAKEGYKFYDNIDIAVKYGNKMLLSDAGCAAILLHAAIETSIINVKVNLNSLREKSFSKGIEMEIASIEVDSLKRKEAICKKVNEIIYPGK